MHADWAVELAAGDPTLAVPWSDPDGSACFIDLRAQFERISELPEAAAWPELAAFLAVLNSPGSLLQSAKCEVWSTRELTVEDEIFGATAKLGGYVDVFLSDAETRLSFPAHESLAQRLAGLLQRAPEMPSSCEILIRRAHFAPDSANNSALEVQAGFYFTLYLFGFGDDQPDCRKHWSIALTLVQNAIVQLSQSPGSQ